MAAIKKLLMFAVLFCFTNSISCLPLRDEDEIIHNVRLERNRVLSRRSASQSLRIHFVYIDVNISNVQVIKELLDKAALYFKNTFKVKYPVKKILLQRKCANNSYFLRNEAGSGPGNVRYCKVSCDRARPSCGLARVGDKDLDVCRVCDEHGQNCQIADLQSSSVGPGYTDTDFVLYITALTDKCDKPKTVAYAAACQQEMSFDRPIAGFLNVCPNKISNKTLETDNHELLSTIKHEIFHALGFSPSLYAFYRNTTGSPMTERHNGLPPFDSRLKMYKWSDKVVKNITRSNWKIREDKGTNGEVDHNVHIMVTPRVRDEAQKHFNCSSLEGAELENQGGPGTELAHWEKRLFENEGMTGAFTQNSVFSRITIALMEDTGWYEANYDMAEPLRWGKNLGCVFAKNSCKAWMIAQSEANNSIQPFCTRLKKKNEGLHTGCSMDKSSVAMCNLVQYNKALPKEYQYFQSLPGIPNAEYYGGSVDYADYCPYFQAFTWTKEEIGVRGSSCTVASNQKPKEKNYALEQYGNTKCFAQGQKWQKTKCRTRWITSDWGSGCYKYQCSDDSLRVLVNGYKFKCYHKGQVLDLEIQGHDGWIHKGSIICPLCQDMCYNAKMTCPAEVRPAPHKPDIPKINPVACQANTLSYTQFYVLGISITLQILYLEV